MKKLMVAASAAALSAAVFADVYNVKFTASTLVDADGNKATRKVKGDEQDYYKKNTVTVTGVYDDSDGKYYFWTGSGKNLEPVTNAVFEITNDTEMDERKLTDAGRAVNVGLYIGQSDNLQSYFVSGGIGKGALNTKNKEFPKDWTAELVSASGSFGGTWYGLPAYGSWSFSKNATASKSANGIAEYVAKQGKAKGVTTANWTGTSDIGTKLDAWREAAKEADTVSAMIKQIAQLTGTNTNKEKEIDEYKETIADNEAKINEYKNTIADNEAQIEEYKKTITANEATIAAQQGQINSDAAVLEQVNKDLDAKIEELKQTNADLEKSNTDLAAANDALKKAQDDLLAKDGEIATLKDEIAANKAQIAAQEAAIADNEATIATNEVTIAANVAKIAEQQDQIDSDTEALAQANADLAAKNAELAEKNEALEKSNADLAAANEALENANADLFAKDGEIATLEETIAENKAQIAANEAQIAANKAKIAEQEGQIDSDTAALAQANADLAAKNAELAAKNADLAAKIVELAAANDALEQANAELLAKDGEIATLKETIAANEAKIDEYKETIAANEAKINEQQDLIDSDVEALAKVNEDLAAKIAELEQANADLGATLAELKALDNEKFDGVIETISDYLKRVIESQDALTKEAAEKIAAANEAIAAYEEAVSDDFEAKLVENLAAASNAVDAASADYQAAAKDVEEADAYLAWLYDVKTNAYEDVYVAKTNDIVKTAADAKAAKQAEIDAALVTYEADKAVFEVGNDTLIDDTLPGETNKLADTILDLQVAKAEAAAAYEGAVAYQADKDAVLANYTTEDGKGNYKKYFEDNGIAFTNNQARFDFEYEVYPAMQKDAADAAEATAAAQAADEAAAKELAASNAVLVAKTERLAALIEARENGELDTEIQKQLDDLKTAYEAEKAELEAELEEIGTKEEEDLAAAKKAYDDSYNYMHSDAKLDEEIENAEADAEAKKATAENAMNVRDEAQAARDAAVEALAADVSKVIEDRAAAVETAIGVGPDAEDFEEKKAKFYEGWGYLDGTSANNVAAAKAILERLGNDKKSVDEEE